jgi:hypothetical protein
LKKKNKVILEKKINEKNEMGKLEKNKKVQTKKIL